MQAYLFLSALDRAYYVSVGPNVIIYLYNAVV